MVVNLANSRSSTHVIFGETDASGHIKLGASREDKVVSLEPGPYGRRVELHYAYKAVGQIIVGSTFPVISLAIYLDGGWDSVSDVDFDSVSATIEQVCHAACFELECHTGHELRTNRIVEAPAASTKPRLKTLDAGALSLPRNSYDPDALDLYLEAGNAARTTNKYLFYYQVLEFFFDQAVEAEAHASVERVFRDPRFHFGGSEQIREIVRQAQRFTSNVNERQQLKLVIQQISSRDQIASEFQSGSVAEFLGERKQRLQGVTQVRIHHDNNDLISELSGRVHSIRNRIVHSKQYDSYHEAPPLWPTSNEARLLSPDIELVKFLAQRALIRYSTTTGW